MDMLDTITKTAALPTAAAHAERVRNGRAPRELRQAFNEAIGRYVRVDDTEDPLVDHLYALCGKLWNCTDLMPRLTCNDVSELLHPVECGEWDRDAYTVGCSFARGARRVRAHIEQSRKSLAA